MGVSALYCCFRDMKDLLVNMVNLVALAANVLAIIFLVWPLADLYWIHKSTKGLYITSFIFLILILILLVITFILLILRNGGANYSSIPTINNVGSLLCLVILGFCVLTFILLFIGFIIELKDYHDYKDGIKGKDWAGAIIPAIITFICLVVIALCVNRLFAIFKYSTVEEKNVTIKQNSMETIPNTNNNNLGINPPAAPYQN